METASAIALSLALGAGAVAGKEIVAAAVKDAYGRLKELLKSRYPGVSVQQLEAAPESKVRQAVVEEDLAKSGATDDHELVAAAQHLADLIQRYAPTVAPAIGVDLRNVTAANLRLADIVSTGTGVNLDGGTFSGDIDIQTVRAGVGGDMASKKPRNKTTSQVTGTEGVIQISAPVGGNVSISDVTVQIYRSDKERLNRIEWRSLEQVNYPVMSDSDHARAVFCDDIRFALRDTFEDEFKRFTFLFNSENVQYEGQSVPVYIVHCHQVKFASMLRKRASERIKTIMTIQGLDEPARMEAKHRYADEAAEEGKIWTGWSLRVKVDFNSNPSAVDVTYDPQTSLVELNGMGEYSLDPSDYRNHLTTTSELLRYVAATSRQRVGFFGDIKWAINNLRLMKLLFDILDHNPIRLEKISINANDFEEWDYQNAGFEELALASPPTG